MWESGEIHQPFIEFLRKNEPHREYNDPFNVEGLEPLSGVEDHFYREMLLSPDSSCSSDLSKIIAWEGMSNKDISPWLKKGYGDLIFVDGSQKIIYKDGIEYSIIWTVSGVAKPFGSLEAPALVKVPESISKTPHDLQNSTGTLNTIMQNTEYSKDTI